MALPKECRLCNAPIGEQFVTTSHVYGGSREQAFFRCGRCGVNYLYPPLSREEEQKFYAMEFEKFMAGRAGSQGGWHHPEEHVRANSDHFKRRMRYLTELLPHRRALRICEIGCSSGFMLYPLREAGHEVFGVEPSGVFGEYLRHRGIEFVTSVDELFNNGAALRQFDLVMHFFVLEHVSNPKTFLHRNVDLLCNDGMVVMEVPSASDPLVSVYDMPAFERFYWSVAHHWYFTEPALHYLLGNLGYPFRILRDQRYDLSNHLVWAMTGRPGGQGRFSSVFGDQADAKYRQLWVEQGNCDTIIGVIKKGPKDG